MEVCYQDIPRFYTALAEWGACIVYLWFLEKRYSRKKTALIGIAALLVQTLVLVLTGDVSTIFWIPCMLLAFLCMYGFIRCCSKVSPLEALYCCARAFLLAELAASLEWQFHTYLLFIGVDVWQLQILLLLVIYAGVFGIACALERSLFSREYLGQLTAKEAVSSAGIVIAVFAFSNLSFIFSNTPFSGRLRADIFNIRTLVDLGGVAALYAFQSRICEYLAEQEVTAIESTLKSQYDQYRNYQESMEMLHIMYHDLKHQIAGLRAETDVEKRKRWLDAMEEELERNQLVNQTGNQVLDTILAAKIFQTKKNQIRITCVADGKLLNFMHVTDICSIFGNALDNAVESVVMLKEPEKRLIHVSVSAQKRFVFIQVSNYCEQRLELNGKQMPGTTKLDKKKHGFGLKSICYAVEKYGGTVSVDVKKSWFELRILIPMKK